MDNGRKFSSRSTTIEAFDVFKKKNVRLKVYSIEKTDRIGTPATQPDTQTFLIWIVQNKYLFISHQEIMFSSLTSIWLAIII